MLKSLEIRNFRRFESFELQQLGRINLLVGSNNSGKTSILEATHLLQSRADLTPLKEHMLARGELSIPKEQQEGYTLDAKNLFHNYSFSEQTLSQVLGRDEDDSETELLILMGKRELSKSFYAIPFYAANKNDQLQDIKDAIFDRHLTGKEDPSLERLPFLHFVWRVPESSFDVVGVRLSSKYALREQDLRAYTGENMSSLSSAYFVRSSSLTPFEMVEIFNRIVLTPDEDLVNEALQIIEPTVKRIASIGLEVSENRNAHGNFFVLRSDINRRVPIGNMGEGMWRMLGLALGLVNAKGGILLVDDIDTGLHFSTMLGMWKMIWETAKRLDVQVFATTHNSDCWTSLAEIARSQDAAEQGITIHRIEKDKQRSVVFNERRIVIAADQDIEVR
jgi:AAA15 family ATPase/GTPase